MEKPVFDNSKQKKRPNLLVVLLILSFIGNGLQFISNLFYALYKDFFVENMDKSGFNMEDFKEIFELPYSYFQLSALFYFFALLGAILMWNLRKLGFHIYSLSKIAALFVLTIYNPFNSTPIFPILTTTLFILLYYRHIKLMS